MEAADALRAFGDTPLAMALVDGRRPFRVLAANDRFLAATELAGPVDGRPLAECVPGASEGAFEAVLTLAVDSGRVETLLVSRSAPANRHRHWEITVCPAPALDAVLCVGRDVTGREEERRRLEATNARSSAFASVAAQSNSLEPERVLSTVASAAADLCDGPSAIYLAEVDGRFRRATARRVSPEMLAGLPEFLTDRLSLLSEAVTTGTTRSRPDLHNLPDAERRLIREARASWMAATPVRGHNSVLGILLTFWKQPVGLRLGDLQALEFIAGQLALSLEHARFLLATENERARLEALIEQMPDSVWITDAAGRLTQTNSAGRRLLALGPDEPLPSVETLSSRLTRHDIEPAGPGGLGLGEALAGKAVFGRLHALALPGDGGPAWLQASAAPVYDPAGQLICAIAVATNITERKQVEESLRLLAEVSELLTVSADYESALNRAARLLVPAVADYLLVDLIEEEGSVRRVVNATGAAGGPDLTHWSPEPLRHRALRDMLLSGHTVFHPSSSPSLLSQLARDDAHRQALEQMGLESYIAVPLVARGRTVGVLQMMSGASRRRYATGGLWFAEDLARRAATAVDNARLYRKAQEADRRKDEFLAVLSHELRTPLTPIMGWIQMVQRNPDPAYIQHATAVIERNVRLQTRLIGDLLDLTAIEQNRLAIEFRPLDLRDVIRAALDTLAEQVKGKGLELHERVSDSALLVEGDGSRLQQVFGNLLSNAIKFTPGGGQITIEATRDGDTVVARVRDTGEGIIPDFLPHVFDMFRQQEEGTKRSHGGLGIGLALAKRFIERHRGSIDAKSAGPGSGAEFIVRLPWLIAVDNDRGRPVGADFRNLPRLDGVRVMVVEDMADTTQAAQVMLTGLGAQVVTARDGVEALSNLDAAAPDLILADLRMPRMDGFELLRRLRGHPKFGGLPVIAVSGLTADQHRRRVINEGFDAYLSKPFEYADLATAVHRMITSRRRKES